MKFTPATDPGMDLICQACAHKWEQTLSGLDGEGNILCPACGAVHPLNKHDARTHIQNLLDVLRGQFPG